MTVIMILVCLGSGAFAYAAEGVLVLDNRVADVVDAPIFWIDGTTRLAGPTFLAQLYAGTSASSLAAVGDALPFRTGPGAGFIDTRGVDPIRTIPGVVAGDNAYAQIRAWDATKGHTYEAALATGGATGFSNILVVRTESAEQGRPPPMLFGLLSFSLTIPEPPTVALEILGATLLIIRQRKDENSFYA